MRSVKHQHAAIIFFLTLLCQQLSDLQAERSFKKQILMMLPTVATASETGIKLAQFGNSGQQPLLAPDTPNGSRPSLAPRSFVCISLQMIHLYGQGGEQALLLHPPSLIFFIGSGVFGCRTPGMIFFVHILFVVHGKREGVMCWYACSFSRAVLWFR